MLLLFLTASLSLFPLTLAGLTARATCPNAQDPGQGAPSAFVNRSDANIWPWLQFKSEPSLNPPLLDIVKNNGEPLSQGLLFLSPEGAGVKSPGPVIYNDQGQLIWKGVAVSSSGGSGVQPSAVNNLRVQTFNGANYLTYWEGFNDNGANVGMGFGSVTFLDNTYNTKFTICPKLGLNVPPQFDGTCQADIHEQLVTSRNTLLVTAYNATRADLRSVGGPQDGWIWDAMLFELSIPDGRILFSWSSLQHQPITKSRFPLKNSGQSETAPWDFFHINSIAYIPALGAYLVNSRHTWSTLLIDAQDGHVRWQIDGETGGDFASLPAQGHFRWQHDARVHNLTQDGVTISWFNNNNAAGVDTGSAPTIGLAMRFPIPPNKNVAVQLLEHLEVPTQELYAGSQGKYSFQPGPNAFDTMFMAYGQLPVLREYGPASDGSDLRWQATFGGRTASFSYRGYKVPWAGQPSAAPKLVLSRSSDGSCPQLQAFASWNGATEVTGWSVYEGSSPNALSNTGMVSKTSFETSFTPSAQSSCVQVGAIANGREVGRSNVACG